MAGATGGVDAIDGGALAVGHAEEAAAAAAGVGGDGAEGGALVGVRGAKAGIAAAVVAPGGIDGGAIGRLDWFKRRPQPSVRSLAVTTLQETPLMP